MQVSNFRSPISVEERVAVTIWKLATNVEYRTLSALFGLGRSTICTIVVNTCQAIATHLLPECVQIPNDNRMKKVVEGFEKYWGIVRPQESASDYYNRKGFYSIIMQAVVDFRGLFTDVYIGWPGKVHDARVFVKSSVYLKGKNGTLFPPDLKRTLCGVEVCTSYQCNHLFIFHNLLTTY